MRADLHMHGPIGFEPYWLEVQGYKGKNLLELIVNSCLNRGIDISAITSITDQVDDTNKIPRNSIHDRLNHLTDNYAFSLPKDYKTDRLGKNIFIIHRDNKTVYLVNGQTPIVKEGEKRFDHLVIGSNEVPNFMNFRDTLAYCNDHGLAHGLEHPNVEAHFGVGLEKAVNLASRCDFIEGHNAQLMLPRIFSLLPTIGQFTKNSNNKAKEFAREYNVPYIATSDAHRIQDVGMAYIEFNKALLNTSDEDRFIGSLRDIIITDAFITVEGCESLLGWINWISKFQRGIRNERYKLDP